jgi:hypothetical protein
MSWYIIAIVFVNTIMYEKDTLIYCVYDTKPRRSDIKSFDSMMYVTGTAGNVKFVLKIVVECLTKYKPSVNSLWALNQPFIINKPYKRKAHLKKRTTKLILCCTFKEVKKHTFWESDWKPADTFTRYRFLNVVHIWKMQQEKNLRANLTRTKSCQKLY